MELHAQAIYTHSYWNKVCACVIPANATAEVILEQTGHSISRLYDVVLEGENGCYEPKDMLRLAVSRLVKQLKDRGLTGRLKIHYAY